MYLLEIDHSQNRVHITLSERFDESEALALLEELRLRLNDLERGFHVLCDLTTLKEFDHSATISFRGVMDCCNANGVGKVVRIIPDPVHNFGLNVMSMFHYDSRIPVITCQSFSEALRYLK